MQVMLAPENLIGLQGVVEPIRLGTKNWVWTWWPSAMEACDEYEKAIMESSENLNSWAVSGARWEDARITSTAVTLKQALDEAKVGLSTVLNPKPRAPEPTAPKEERRGRFAFVRSLPVLRSFIGPKGDTTAPETKVQKEDKEQGIVGKAKGGFQLSVLKAADRKVTPDVASGPIKSEVPDKESVEKSETGVTFPSPLPILQSITGGSGERENTGAGSEEAEKKPTSPLAAAAESIISTTAKATQAEPQKLEPKAQAVLQRSTTRPEVVKTKGSAPMKPTSQAEKGRQDSEVPKQSVLASAVSSEGSGVLSRFAVKTGTGSDKVSTGDAVQASKQTTGQPSKGKVSTPVGLGKGLSGAPAKSSGGAVGGPFKLGGEESSKVSLRFAMQGISAAV